MHPKNVAEFFKRLAEQNPNPTTELAYTNPYTLLVAVILSAQSTDAGVNRATDGLFKTIKTPDDMVKLGLNNLKQYIKTIGLFNTKAKNIIAMSEILIKDFNSCIPRRREELQSLPGVGRKTANVILNTIYGDHVMAVDTHVFRLSNRTGLAPGKNPSDVETRLMQVIPAQYMKDAHHHLILHGRYVCVARSPKCAKCIVRDLCSYKEKTPIL